MGIFDKLKFWKKEDDFDFDSLTNTGKDPFAGDDLGLNKPQEAAPSMGMNEKSPFEQLDQHAAGMAGEPAPAPMPQASPSRGGGGGRDLELVNSKLDTIKALLNSIDQRVANLERASGVQKEEKRLW